jgi:transposase-like protein
MRPFLRINPKGTAGRRSRQVHSNEFKADTVAAASQPGMSLAAVALTRGHDDQHGLVDGCSRQVRELDA